MRDELGGRLEGGRNNRDPHLDIARTVDFDGSAEDLAGETKSLSKEAA